MLTVPYTDMRMPDPIPTFTYLVRRLAEDYPKLAYLHLVEIGVSGNVDTIPAADEVN